MSHGATRLYELTSKKEQELIQLRERQQKAIEQALSSCQDELQEEKGKRKVLEDDFKYNLSLIEQRDNDLLRYETIFEELKKVINSRMEEMSDLRVQVDDLASKLTNAEKDKGELKKYYMQRLEQQQSHMDQYCKTKDTDVTQQRTEYERLQKQLQQRLLQVEEELSMEKQQMITEKEDCMRTMEQEQRIKLDELTAQLLSKESHLRQLQRELSLAQNGVEQKHKDVGNMEDRVKELEKEQRELEWDHTDEINTLQTRITELEGQLSHSDTINRTLRNDSDNRRVELERLIKEKETIIQSIKESHHVKQTELERQLGEVRALLEQREIEGRRKEWSYNDNMKEKELQIEKLQGDILRLREDCERKITQYSQETVQTDLQMEALQTTCEKLKGDITARIQDIDRYKQELHLSNERLKSVERSKGQLELDWQARLEDMERSQYGRQEELLKTLTTARDQSIVQCKRLEEKLLERVKVCESLRQERNIALDTLQKKGLTDVTREILKGRGSTEVIETLQRQNNDLREIISHMRNEMEKVTEPVTQNNKDIVSTTDPSYKMNKGYILYLESEIKRLTNENKTMKPTKKPPLPSKEKKHNPTSPPLPNGLKIVLDKLQKEKATQELDMAELRSHIRQLEATTKSQQHQAYIQKALKVPKDKLHIKLLQATKVIISLVEERDEMRKREMEQKNRVDLLEKRLKQIEESNIDKEDDNNGLDSSILTDNETEYNSIQKPNNYWFTQVPTPPHPHIPSSNTNHVPSTSHNSGTVPPMYTNTWSHVGQDPLQSRNTISTYQPLEQVPDENLSLSPLRFSDCSTNSGLQALQKAMKLIDDDTTLSLDESTPIKQDMSKGKENRRPKVPTPLVVEGNQITCNNRRNDKGNCYKVPSLNKQQQKPKIINYNIID